MNRRAAVMMAALCFSLVAAVPAYADQINGGYAGNLEITQFTDEDIEDEMHADELAALKQADNSNVGPVVETEETEAETETQEEKKTDRETLAKQTKSETWNGAVLSSWAGTVTGPSGKETYYNLNMSQVVANMHARGYEGEYWVRDDGCKMFGDYIMCAANLSIRPFGTIIESSLGTCMVVDTGGFASYNATQLDIATTW